MKDGKVFGKINIIDLLVILIAVIIVVAVGIKMNTPKESEPEEVGTSIRYTVFVENVDSRTYDSIVGYIEAAQAAGHPGDQMMASGEMLDGYVVAVTATPHPNEATLTTMGGGVTVYSTVENRVDLVFDVIANVTSNIKTNVGTQEVRAGKPHILKTTHFEFSYATILTCEWAGGTGAGY